jgi:outer membrane protein OmpA-like peptidoglycan-associated protein
MDTSAFAAPVRRALAFAILPLGLCLFEPTADAQSVTFGGGAQPAPGAAPAPAAPPPAAAGPAASGGGAPAAPAAAEEAPIDSNHEWAERDKLLYESPALTGGNGLLRTQHAQGGAPHQFHLAFTTEYFSAGFLCTSTYPCANPNGGAPITSDTMNHIGGTISLSATLFKFLEAYASTGAQANADTANKPSLLQVLGDTDFGVKGFGHLARAFWIGGAMELWLINGTGAVGVDGSGTSAKFRAIPTLDLRELESHVPLRVSLNFTYSLDNSGSVLQSTEQARGAPVTRIERFGLDVNRVDHFDINIGAETFLLEERIRPFVEAQVLVPVNRQDYLCPPINASNDKCLANDKVAPSKLTIGSRFFPWNKYFSVLLAADIGLSGVKNFIEEVAPTPPWTLYLGLGWSADARPRPPTVVTKNVEKVVQGAAAPRAHIKGFVHEKDKVEGIAAAIVAWDNHPELTSLATGPDGRFTTQELAEGGYKFALHAEGYKDGSCETTLAHGAVADVQLDCPLEALPRVGTVVGHVRDAASNGALPNATVRLTDAQGKELRVNADSEGGFKIGDVPPGNVTLQVDADNYLALVQTGTVKVRQENVIDLLVQPKPKNPLVQVGAKEITIKTQIQFALDSAVILPESFGLMSEIADTLIKHSDIVRVEVQGHTDNSGTPEHNKILSEQRANAVRDWLNAHGVPPDRLVARGYGQDKPIVPNVTQAMKAKNRRVQFIILEKASAPAVGGRQ